MHTLIGGAVAGFAGTVAMTALIAAEKLSGLMREDPAPEIISAHVETAVGLRKHLPEPVFQVSWLLQHFGYGTNAGVGYALARKLLPAHESKPMLAGAVYGSALYLIGYAGWLPLAHVYPPPTQNPPRKVAMLVVEHLVFGATAALAYRALAARDAS